MGEDIPPPEEQRKLLFPKLIKSLVVGETWYLIERKWYESWKAFVSDDKTGLKSYVPRPGPIDNSPLLDNENKELRTALVDKMHYELVCQDVWDKLVEWYGLEEQQAPIAREVIYLEREHCHVEIYLCDLRCYKDFQMVNELKLRMSKKEVFAETEKRLRKQFNVPSSLNSRLWSKIPSDDEYKPVNVQQGLSQFGNPSKLIIVIEFKQPHEQWREKDNRITGLSQLDRVNNGYNSSSPNYTLYTGLRSSRQLRQSGVALPPGVCGISNLGNTCYLSSVVQCLSNCPPIAEYFLAQRHLDELNTTNPLGMNGEIAIHFGKLVQQLWSGNYSVTSPMDFKIQVGKFNPTFCGSAQHDCQELLTFLLDGLNEDLNRIKSKPYVEIKDHGGRDDEEVANEAWVNHKKRNDSIIVDTFHGLLKSTVVCPKCGKLSVTFDPFCYLALPLPMKADRLLTVTYIPYDGNEREHKYRFSVPRKGLVKELCREVAKKIRIQHEDLLVAEVLKSHFHKFYSPEDSLELIDDKDQIFVFQIPDVDDSTLIIPVCCWEMCKSTDKFSRSHLFGVPFLLAVPEKPKHFEEVYDLLFEKMQRHFNFPPCVYQGTGENKERSEVDAPSQNSVDGVTVPFNLYVLDVTTFEIKQVDIEDAVSKFIGLFSMYPFGNIKNFDRNFGRKILLVQFTPDQRREFYREKPASDHLHESPSRFDREHSKISIHDCLNLFTTCEKLGAGDAWFCPSCKLHHRATKKFDLWKLPRMLIIHLKRFSYTKRSRDKIDIMVDCPITDLSINHLSTESPGQLYDLVAVSYHFGNMGGGHYTASCKNKDNGKWYSFNDSSVIEISPDCVMSSNAYVLIYMAKENPVERMDSS